VEEQADNIYDLCVACSSSLLLFLLIRHQNKLRYDTSFLDKFTKHVMMLANLGADNLAPHTLALSLSKITIAKPPTEPKRQKQKKLDSLAPREAAA